MWWLLRLWCRRHPYRRRCYGCCSASSFLCGLLLKRVGTFSSIMHVINRKIRSTWSSTGHVCLYILPWHKSVPSSFPPKLASLQLVRIGTLCRWAQNQQCDGRLGSFHGRALQCSPVHSPVKLHSPLITPLPCARACRSCVTLTDPFSIWWWVFSI